jgi:hypothetical protein
VKTVAIPLSGKEVFTEEVNTMIGGLLYATGDAEKNTEKIVPIIQELERATDGKSLGYAILAVSYLFCVLLGEAEEIKNTTMR